jgi:signal peptidase I
MDTAPLTENRSPKSAPEDAKPESWWDVLRFAFITLVIIIPIRLYIAQPFIVSGDSMVPTFHNGEYLIVDELSYRFDPPRRGDVVIFRFPEDPSKYFIKRIVGLPGETVTVSGGKVFITGKTGTRSPINEPYLKQITNRPVSTKVGADQYFVMGDNRSVSYDSRYWGPVNIKYIRGRAILRLWPLGELGVWPGKFNDYQSKP